MGRGSSVVIPVAWHVGAGFASGGWKNLTPGPSVDGEGESEQSLEKPGHVETNLDTCLQTYPELQPRYVNTLF
jgi:hypothetical protein